MNKSKKIYNFLLFSIFSTCHCILVSSERLMMGSTMVPLQTIFKLVSHIVFEKLSKPKTCNRQGYHKVRRQYQHFRPK